MKQLNIFDCLYPEYHIDKPIRLIELFAGIGSQAMALRDLGADFEHHKVVEFDKFAIASYNAIHGTHFPLMDITAIKGMDLEINDTDKYCYIMTYSFPCQDLSVSGKQKGMSKGSGTRSGLLWEVERLLNETENLPQVLLMENVPQIVSKQNLPDFQKWHQFLENKGYSNYLEILNAKNYGVAQNRKRAFMVSILGKYNYKFPEPVPLKKNVKDYLEDEVDEKYYISNEKAKELIEILMDECNTANKCEGEKVCVNMSFIAPKIINEASTVTASYNRCLCETFKQADDGVLEMKVKVIGRLEGKYDMANNRDICRIELQYRIRRFTPRETGRLMDISEEDIDKILAVNSESQAYKQFGNSIVVRCMVAILSNLNIQGKPNWKELKSKLKQ